jgi:ABC-type Zn uptake system ZnuABC Zn-binding protein ZnuA
MKKVLIGGSLMLLLLTSCTSKVDVQKETPVQPVTQTEGTPTEKQKIFTSFYPMYFLTK